MAFYRTVSLNFWTDPKVDDYFTPEDKYFYLYLLTNPHTNLCGCYEIGLKQMERELGYNKDTVLRLIERMENEHKVCKFDKDTCEILVLNWGKHNWSTSEATMKAVINVGKYIKSDEFKKYVFEVLSGFVIEKTKPEVREEISNILSTVTDNRIQNTVTEYSIQYTDATMGHIGGIQGASEKPIKHKFGEYRKVLLTDDEYERLLNDFGESSTKEAIKFLDEYIAEKGYKSKSHNLAMRRWVFDAIGEKKSKKPVKQETFEERWANA